MNTGELTVEIKNMKKNSVRCENHQKDENDRIQDTINEHKTTLATTKKGIYDHIEKVNSNLESKINAVSKDVNCTKWSIVKWLFIVMGASAFLQGLVNKIFTLGG